jgi:hypothetical protein
MDDGAGGGREREREGGPAGGSAVERSGIRRG